MIASITGSAALAFVLGLRHGLDADHLAAIDGLTRWNAGQRRAFAPYCGALFAAGHGSVILAAATGLSFLASQWQPPVWLGPAGALVSAVTLLLLSAINLRIAFGTSRNGVARPIGLRSQAFGALLRAPNACQVALLGALFALSFDAIALATLFAASGAPSGNVAGAASLALAFALGMVTVGAANGLWVMRLLRHSDEASRYASRLMTLTISLIGLTVGTGVLLCLVYPPLERWVETNELAIGGSVATLVLAGYFGALILTSQSRRFRSAALADAPKPGAI